MKAYFDPGGACAGWAVFDGSQLVACGLSRTKEKDWGNRARAHRKTVRIALLGLTTQDVPVLSEMMWHRPKKGKKKGFIPPQDLVHANLVAGHVGTDWVYPHTWKGMVPKEEHQPKILAALAPEELALVEAVMPPYLRHNMIDAVGIGLYDVGRLAQEAECEECRQVKKLIARTKKLSAPRSTRGSTSAKSKGTRGKRRPMQPSWITLPKGSIRMPAPTDPGTLAYRASTTK